MPSIEEYRNTFPELKGLDDVDVIRNVAKAYDVPIEAVTAHMGYEPKGGDFWRQFKNSGTQTEQLLAGAGAAAAATAESAFGPGGFATAAKNAALEKYKSIGEELQINSKASDSATTAYDMARNGDPGALVDFLQGAIGMGLGQIGQSVLTAGAGGLLGKAALKGTVERVAGGMVEKETAALMEAHKKISKDVAEKVAVSNVANRIGQNLAITGQVLQQEGGEIGGDLTQKATDEGRVLTGAEVFRALAATVAATGPEALTDRVVLDALFGKMPWLKSLPEATTIGGKVGRAAIAGGVGAGIGGAQEVAQTYTEELGKGNPIDEKAHRSAIDAGVMGAIAGAMPGAVGGYIHGPDITLEKDQGAIQENAGKSPNQVTVEQVNQLRDARLRQLDEEERGIEGGLYKEADGSTTLRVGKMGRQLTPQEMGERLFLTRNPNPAIVAKRFGLILTPDSADTVASDIAKTEIPSVSSGQKPFDGVDEVASVAGQVTAFEQAAKQTPSVPIPEGIHPEQRTPSTQIISPVDEQLNQETGIPPIQPAAIQQVDNGLDVGAGMSDQPAQEQAQIPVEKTAMEMAFEKARNKTNIPEQAARVSPEETSTLALVDQPISQIPDQPGQVALQKSEAQAQLPTQEAQQAVKTSEIPGVKSRQALEQDTGKQATTVINLDGLKAISDTYGQEAETKAIKALTESAKAAGLDVYHVEGNNFAVLSANAIKAKRDVAALKAQADQVQVDLGDHVMNGIPISHGTARSLPDAIAKSQQEQVKPNITQKPIPSAREVMDKANEEPDTGVLPKGLTDRRFLKESYRSAVQSLSNSLVPGGGIAHIKDEHDRIIGRTSSVNPMWFQDFKEVFPSVKAVDKAVKKALEGKTLGKSEARIITGLMNAYDSEIADSIQEYGNPNDYRVMYEEERDAMGDIGSTPGEFLIAKLYNKALDSGIPENEIVSVIGSHRDDYAGAITALEGMIDEAKSETENQYQENTNAYARQDQGSGQEAAGVREQEAFALTNEKDGATPQKAKPDKSEVEAENRRKADSEAKDFRLSGSNRPADIAVAGGQQDLIGKDTETVKKTDQKENSDSTGSQDLSFYYTDGKMGMTSNGTFTADKSRWVAFSRSEAMSFESRNIKPAYATRHGVFTGVNSGSRLKATSNERKPNPVPNREGNSRPVSKKATPVQGQFDLFSKPGESKRQAYADLYHVIVKAKPVATIRSAVDHISSPEDVGHLMASIRKDAQEAMYAVVTDKAGKILRVFRHTKGHKTSSSVSPLIIVSEAASIEGANTIHLVHNHPSGNPSPSKDDERVTEATARSAEGTGMSVGYHVVIGKSAWQEVGTSSPTKFVPMQRKHSIQITERTFVKNDPSDETIGNKDNLAKAFRGIDSGILLLNYQHQVAGVIMMSDAEMQALKSGGGEGAKRILAAIDKSNASAIALKTDSMPSAKNIGSFVSAIRGSGELRLLDWIDSKGASAAESGNIDALYNLGGVYTSKNTDQESIPDKIVVDGISRPTRNSNGQLIARDKEKLKAFWQWFGDSKVVDSDGRPLVMYHGTGADFTAFSHDSAYSGEGASQTGSGFYFTDNPDSASRYAQLAVSKGASGRVMPVYLSIKNPLFIDFSTGEVMGADIKLSRKQVREMILGRPNIRNAEESPLMDFGDIAYDGFDKVLNQAINSYAGGSNIAALRNDFFGNDHEAWLKALSRATGHDGAYTTTMGGDTHWVAWQSEQIKSAIGNRGTYDSSNPSIVASRSGQQRGATANSDKIVSAISNKFGDKVLTKLGNRLVIPNTEAELRAEMEKRGSKFTDMMFSDEASKVSRFQTHNVKGFYDPSTDTSYLLPWNMKESEAPGVFLHEVGVHYGLEKMLGDKYPRVVGDTAKMVRMGSKSAMDAMRSVNAAEGLGFDPDSQDFRNQMADKILSDKRIAQEAIAYIAEKNANHPFVKRIVSAIKEFLYRIGFTGKLDEGMLTTMAIRAARRGDASGIVVNGVDAMRSSRAPNWYSQMSRVLGNKLSAKGSVEQMKRVIEAFQRKGDFKAEELEYSGIIPWLDEQEGSVTRDDIIEQLALNAIYVRDVTLEDKRNNAIDDANGRSSGSTKFGEHQLPGGTNYREVLLTLPIDSAGNDFRSPHFDQPNIVAHLRVNDRTDANGKRVLFVEEVQSDWHQEGRKKGYKDTATESRIEAIGKELQKLYRDPDYGARVPRSAEIASQARALENERDNLQYTSVPNAPFKNSWPMLAMKTALRMAVEGGYDSIGWTDGETQALRYQDDNAETMMKRYKGMVKFYDEILPNTVNKFVKKWGGRVDKSSITTGPTVDEIRDGENKGAKVNRKIHIVPITDGMREEIPNGLPLFSSASRETERETPAQSLVGDKFTIPPLTRFQKVIRKLQDESVVFQAVQDAVEKQGGTITEATNMSEAIKRYPGRLAAAMKDTTDNLVEPFMKRIHDAGTTMDEVALLAYAEFAPIRNAEIAKINDRFPNNGEPGKSGSGMTDIEAAEIVKQAKEHPNSENLFALAEELRSIPERNLENRVAGGVMTQEQADEYTAKSPKYIPLKGFELADERGVTVGTGQGLSTGSKLDFRALGRSSRAGQIFENTIRDYEIGLQLVEKANVARTIREFVKANPDKKLWDVDNAPEKPYLHKGGVVYQVWSGDRVIVELASQKDAKAIVDGLKATDPDARLEEVRPSPNVHMRETQFDPTEEIRFIEDGKPVRIQLFNEDMARSYNRLWHSGVPGGLTILNNYNSWLRQFYTQKNPAWFVMNALKDVQSVIPYVTGEAGVKVAMKVPGNLRGAFKAAWAMHHGLKAEGGWDETIKQFMNSGGYTGFSYVGDIEAQTLRLNGAIARYTPWDEAAKKFKTEGIKKGVAAVGAKVLNTRFFSWIESMNSTFENMTRLAVFKAGMDGGMTANEAGKLAKNASTNFNTRGEWGPNINAVWLFANAGIQGTRNVGHALLFSKHREQVWALMGGLAALGVMAGMMSDDDDDLLDDQLRSRYLAMKFGDSQVSIPMPYGFGFFAGFGQLVAQVIKHPEKQEQLAVKMASLAADHFSPFGNPLTDKLDMKNIVNIAPTLPKPFLNVAANVSPFGGSPLYPDSPFDTTRPDSEKMWTATRGSGYDVVAEWLNTLTGGDKVREGAVSVSPETLKLSVSTMFGGAGKLMSDMLSIPFDAANETLSAKKMPIIKNFYREIDKDAYLQRFYEEAKDAQDAYTTFRNYQKQGMVDDATAYRNEEAAYVSMGRLVTTYRKQIKRLKDMEAHINNSDASATEKNIGLAKTNKAIIETTSTFNDRLKSMN